MEIFRDCFDTDEAYAAFVAKCKEKGYKPADLSTGKYKDKDAYEKSETAKKTLETTLAELEAKHKKDLDDVKAAHSSEMSTLKKDYAISKALGSHKVHDEKAIRAFLEADKIKLTDDTLDGLDEQIKTLKESKPFLFQKEQETPGVRINTGGQHVNATTQTPNEAMNRNIREACGKKS